MMSSRRFIQPITYQTQVWIVCCYQATNNEAYVSHFEKKKKHSKAQNWRSLVSTNSREGTATFNHFEKTSRTNRTLTLVTEMMGYISYINFSPEDHYLTPFLIDR
jgi:hypothetical protein